MAPGSRQPPAPVAVQLLAGFVERVCDEWLQFAGLLAGVIGSSACRKHFGDGQGRELAWQNKRWESVEHFNEVQRKWSLWGIGLIFGTLLLGVVAALSIYGVRSYIRHSRGF